MQLIIINYNDFQRFPSLDSLRRYYFPLSGWAKGVVTAGVPVMIFQRYHEDMVQHWEGVPIHLVHDPGPNTTPYQIPLPLHRQVSALCRQHAATGRSTVVHMNGLLYPLQTRWLRARLPAETALVGQHHGSQPWAPGLRRTIQRWGLRTVDGFLFSAAALADEWRAAGLIGGTQVVYPVMETSTNFTFQERAAARAVSGMTGRFVLFWAGNLNQNKDPLTILTAFARVLDVQPEARLYMAYRETTLLPAVQARLAQDARLQQAVTLLGDVPHEQMATCFNSADLFVQGSQKEGAGIALLEALACGVIPIVTDIPAFRALTDGGRIGALWPVGDVAALTVGILKRLAQPLPPQTAATRRLFAERWSFTAIGRQAALVYAQAQARRMRQLADK